jgi:hypothetical protein
VPPTPRAESTPRAEPVTKQEAPARAVSLMSVPATPKPEPNAPPAAVVRREPTPRHEAPKPVDRKLDRSLWQAPGKKTTHRR